MQGHIVILCGQSGCGKSRFARLRTGDDARVLAVDPLGDFGPRAATPDEPACHFETANGLRASMRAILRIARENPAGFRLACRAPVEYCDEILRAAWAIRERGGEKFTIIVDETDSLFHLSRNSGLWYLVRAGRRCSEEIILVTGRLTQIPPAARAAARLCVLWRNQEPNDLDDIRKRWGARAARDVYRLADHEYLMFGPGAAGPEAEPEIPADTQLHSEMENDGNGKQEETGTGDEAGVSQAHPSAL